MYYVREEIGSKDTIAFKNTEHILKQWIQRDRLQHPYFSITITQGYILCISIIPSPLGTASIVCFYLVYEWDAEIFGCLPSVRKILLGRYSGSLSSESEPRMPTRFRLPAAALPGAATTLFSFSEPELRSTRGVSSTFFKIILLILHTL